MFFSVQKEDNILLTLIPFAFKLSRLGAIPEIMTSFLSIFKSSARLIILLAISDTITGDLRSLVQQ